MIFCAGPIQRMRIWSDDETPWFLRPSPGSACSFSTLMMLNPELITRGTPPAFRDDGFHFFIIIIPPTAIGSVPSLSAQLATNRLPMMAFTAKRLPAQGQ